MATPLNDVYAYLFLWLKTTKPTDQLAVSLCDFAYRDLGNGPIKLIMVSFDLHCECWTAPPVWSLPQALERCGAFLLLP
jgi:hypothetical protein